MASHLASKRQLSCSQAFELGEGREGLGSAGAALRVRARELAYDVGQLVRCDIRPAEPVEFTHAEGRIPHDLIGTTYAALTLVSSRFVDVLREYRFTGWTTFPVKVALGDGSELEGYSGLAVTGRCGPIDDHLSEEITLPPPVPGGQSALGLRGLCFAPESWDGGDIFTAEAFRGVFVAECVKDALERATITNVEFRRLSEIERTWCADGSLVGAD